VFVDEGACDEIRLGNYAKQMNMKGNGQKNEKAFSINSDGDSFFG
jgi:hypothetical protein